MPSSSQNFKSKKYKHIRVRLTDRNSIWIHNEIPRIGPTRPSGSRNFLINQAVMLFRENVCSHYLLAQRRFNSEEIKVMNAEFQQESVPWHFNDLAHMHEWLEQIDRRKSHHCQHWRKALQTIKQHDSTLAEINAILFLSKF